MRFGYTSEGRNSVSRSIMELRHLRYFVMAAEEGNVSRAAARLNVSQPAVSRQIRDLEEELGVSLFERNPSGLRLTEAGETALVHAGSVLRAAGVLEESMRAFAIGGSKVSLRVGYLPTALPRFLAEGMRRFHARHPEVCVQIYEMTPSEQERALRGGEIDVGLIGEPSPELKREYLATTIHRTPVVAVVPDDHPLAGRKSIELAELEGDPFLSLDEREFPGRPDMLDVLFSRAGISPEIAIRAKGLSELLGLVGSGAGVGVAPADLEQLPHAGVAFVPLKKPKLTLHFAAVRSRESEGAESVFVETLQAQATSG